MINLQSVVLGNYVCLISRVFAPILGFDFARLKSRRSFHRDALPASSRHAFVADGKDFSGLEPACLGSCGFIAGQHLHNALTSNQIRLDVTSNQHMNITSARAQM
jgi:hypothetical protein